MLFLEANKLRKVYGKLVALDSLTLALTDGAIYGMLGRNGAGKTTFIRLIMGLARPTSGEIKVFGQAPSTGNGRIGYLSENIALFPHLTVMENLRIICLMAKIPKTAADLVGIAEQVGLAEAAKKPAGHLSLGMKRRLQLAMTVLVKKYDLLVLDEPTNGLDVEGLIWFKKLLSSFRRSGITVLLATHSTKEMEELITDYFIIDRGVIIDQGKWDINTAGFTDKYIISLEARLDACLNVLQENNITNCMVQGNTIVVETSLGASHLMRILTEHGIYPNEFKANQRTLEQIFLEKTRRSTINDEVTSSRVV